MVLHGKEGSVVKPRDMVVLIPQGSLSYDSVIGLLERVFKHGDTLLGGLVGKSNSRREIMPARTWPVTTS